MSKNLKPIVNKTVYGNNNMIIKIDGALKKTISGDVGQYALYETVFFIKIVDKLVGPNPVCFATLETHKALAMASHIIDRLNGNETTNFEEIISADQRSSIRAGIFDSGYGVQITSGSAPILCPLQRNHLRGFAELLRVTVQVCEHAAAKARSEFEIRRKKEIKEAANVPRDSQAT